MKTERKRTKLGVVVFVSGFLAEAEMKIPKTYKEADTAGNKDTVNEIRTQI